MRGAGAYQQSVGSTPFFWVCPEDVGTQMPVTGEEVAELLVKALNDTVTQPVYNEERKWNSKWGIFHVAWQNDSIRNADTLLTAFYDSCLTADIGLLAIASHIVGSPLMYDHNKDEWLPYPPEVLDAVMDTLQNISTAMVPEAAMRDMLIIALEHMRDSGMVADSMGVMLDSVLHTVFPDSTFTLPAMGRKALGSTHRTALEAMAEECPYEYGTAVYMARAMLSQYGTMPYMGMNACEYAHVPPSAKWGDEEESDAESSKETLIRVYPNPANGNVNVEIALADGERALLEIWDSVGAKVAAIQLHDSLNTISTDGLNQGLYHMVVSVNGNRKHTVRQIILR